MFTHAIDRVVCVRLCRKRGLTLLWMQKKAWISAWLERVRPLFRQSLVLVTMTAAALADEPIFEKGAKAQLLIEKGAGEGPAWHPQRGLFSSGEGNINVWKDGKSTVFRKDAGSNGLLFDRKGRLLICEPVQRRVTRLTLDGSIEVLTDNYHGKKYAQPNDISIDSKGRIYFSDPRYGPRNDMQIVDNSGRPIEGVYRIDPDGSVIRIITHEVDRPNGLVVSADDRFLFVADNNNNNKRGARKLWRFELNEHGNAQVKTRKLLYDWKSGRGPDGMVLDQKGRLYVAGGLNKPHPPYETAEKFKAGVYVFTPNGKLLDFVAIPRDEVTNCTFGGNDLKMLYITAGGTLWSIRTTTKGRLVWPAN